MRGGFLVALDEGLFSRVASALIELGGLHADDELSTQVVQIADEAGRLFTIYKTVPRGAEWEVRDGPHTAAPGVRLPDMSKVVACPFDCRWPNVVAHLANVAASTAVEPTWLLDSDGVVWDAKKVDSASVRL